MLDVGYPTGVEPARCPGRGEIEIGATVAGGAMVPAIAAHCGGR